MKTIADISDETLVIRSLGGDRDAFEEIVRRYQTLLCSVAYSSNGNVSQSEDIAQETFVTAWTQLADLREPARLKSWLCGIARNLAHNAHRRDARRGTESLENLEPMREPASPEALPDETAARGDDEALAWRALENVPEIYRETLVLYYRQHQSIEHVAASLEISEETVRQRLSRGRKALQDQVLALLGTTLTRTVPAVAFTTSVMSALPITGLPAARTAGTVAAGAAGAGGVVAKASSVAKVSLLALFGGAALSTLLGAVGLSVGNRVAEEMTDSARERMYMRVRGRKLWIFVSVLVLVLSILYFGLPFVLNTSVPVLAISGIVFVTAWAFAIFVYARETTRRQLQIRSEEVANHSAMAGTPARTYVSAKKILGLPLLAIDLGSTRPVRGWIAIGHIAQGGLLAIGQLAIGPIAFGACGIGLISFAAIGMGLVSFSALAVGWWAAGAFAFGYDAMAGVAIASHLAAGGVAWASQFAEGLRVLAPHANDGGAFRALLTHPLFGHYAVMPWVGVVLALGGLLPNLLMLKRLMKRKAGNGLPAR
ncbi:MAG TPA: RNA polymerase sigma factor [Opitutaceae bacterium]